MILHDFTSEPIQVALPGQQPKQMRQRLVTHKITNDKDMKELADEMAKGRDLILQVPNGQTAYVMTREFIPLSVITPKKPVIEGL